MNEKKIFVRQFREIQPKFSRFYARLLTRAHLSLPQLALLSQLVDRRQVSMTEISARLHITKPAVTNLTDRLERGGFLKRIPHPDDRRISLLQIRPKGEKVVRETQSQVLRFLLKALDRLNAAEQKAISRFYALLSQVMDQALSRPR